MTATPVHGIRIVGKKSALIVFAFCALALRATPVRAEKVLIYDEERGIIFVDKDEAPGVKTAPQVPAQPRVPGESTATPGGQSSPQRRRGASRHDIHVGRKKDPPSLYFSSGLEYFKNEDYDNALKNFRFAYNKSDSPRHLLWIAKTHRVLNNIDSSLHVLQDVVKDYRDSDVADDALFEMAFYYQKSDHYDSATIYYERLAEQYPFGANFATGEEYLDISRKQRSTMRAEMISTLKLLGYTGSTLSDIYQNFQQANDLPVTGTGTRETVMRIKAQHQEVVTQEARLSESRTLFQRYRKWIVGAAAVVLLSLLLSLWNRSRTTRLHRHLKTLHATLCDLDSNSL